MAFCTQCGAPLPENGKFCSHCGAAVDADTHALMPTAAEVCDAVGAAALPVQGQQTDPDGSIEEKPAKMKPARTAGTWFSIASFVSAILSLVIFSPVAAILFAAAAIVTGIAALIKKGRLKALVIIAFLVAAFAVVDSVWYIATGEIMLEPSGTEISYKQTQQITEGGITFALPDGYEKYNGNGFATYSYGSDVCVVLCSQKAEASIIDMFTMSNMKDVIESSIKKTLENSTNISGREMTIASCSSWVSEDSGNYNGEKGYAKTAGIKNTAGSSLVICSVLYSADEKEQGQKLFDALISSAVLSGAANKSTGNTNASASGSIAKASGVDPDLAAFLNSYEGFVDEYVAFMKKYMSDPSNAMSMMGDYLKMAEELEDFSEKIDRYDTDKMSTADAAYYLEVMTRCEMKMLSVLG